MSFSKKIMSNVTANPLKVSVEKYMIGSTGNRAKVLFSTNKPKNKIKSALSDFSNVETAFADVLCGKGRVLQNSLMLTEREGVASAIVELNKATMGYDEVVKSNSGFSMVTANVFADADDNVWQVVDEGGEKIVVRNSKDNLNDLLKPNTFLSLASGVDLFDGFEAGSFVRHLHVTTGKVLNGFAVDTCTVYDIETEQFREVSNIDVLATVEVSKEVSNDMLTSVKNNPASYAELSATEKLSLREYLKQLYGHAPDFLRNYLSAIDQYSMGRV
jgi:hypothetical protein